MKSALREATRDTLRPIVLRSPDWALVYWPCDDETGERLLCALDLGGSAVATSLLALVENRATREQLRLLSKAARSGQLGRLARLDSRYSELEHDPRIGVVFREWLSPRLYEHCINIY